MASKNYLNDCPSVTTVLGGLRKIGLENWFKYKTPQAIKEESELGKVIGTQIHKTIALYLSEGKITIKTQYKVEVVNALKGFLEFKKSSPNLVIKNCELAMFSEKYKFNGTLDAIGELDGKPIIFDWKTGNAKAKEKTDIHDDYKYQVSAYVKLYNETFNADISTAIIVSVAKDKVAYNSYTLLDQEINECFEEVFLPALRIYNYQKKEKNVQP